MDITTHFWRDNAAQIPDVFGAINQQPAITGGIYKPPQGLDGQRKRDGIREQKRELREEMLREKEKTEQQKEHMDIKIDIGEEL